jgi:hypothetical protein
MFHTAMFHTTRGTYSLLSSFVADQPISLGTRLCEYTFNYKGDKNAKGRVATLRRNFAKHNVHELQQRTWNGRLDVKSLNK